jgi:hypothetical protein
MACSTDDNPAREKMGVVTRRGLLSLFCGFCVFSKVFRVSLLFLTFQPKDSVFTKTGRKAPGFSCGKVQEDRRSRVRRAVQAFLPQNVQKEASMQIQLVTVTFVRRIGGHPVFFPLYQGGTLALSQNHQLYLPLIGSWLPR